MLFPKEGVDIIGLLIILPVEELASLIEKKLIEAEGEYQYFEEIKKYLEEVFQKFDCFIWSPSNPSQSFQRQGRIPFNQDFSGLEVDDIENNDLIDIFFYYRISHSHFLDQVK